MALPKLTGTRANQVSQIAAWLDVQTHNASFSAGGGSGITYGQAYQTYAAANPSISAPVALEGFILSDVGTALPTVIAQAVIGGAGRAAQLGGDAGSGAGAAGAAISSGPFGSVVDFLNALGNRKILMRIAEGALGIGLIIVGVAKLADGTPLGTALKKVPFV
jgi:hypothetical protein